MKDPKLIKKLTLNKQTVAHLNDKELKEVHGGGNSDPTKCRIATCTCTFFKC